MARVAILAVVLAVLAGSAAGAVAAQRPAPVRARAIDAEFVQEKFLTRYTFEIVPSVTVRSVRFEWRLMPPAKDQTCDLFAVQRPTRSGTSWAGHASWLHGDQHGCHHDVMDGQGHPGYVTVLATIVTSVRGTWQCSAAIRGTSTTTSPYVPGCRKKPA